MIEVKVKVKALLLIHASAGEQFSLILIVKVNKSFYMAVWEMC